MQPKMTKTQVQKLHQIEHKYLLRILLFGLIYICAGFISITIHETISSSWIPYILALPFYLFAAGALHGISLFTHEGVHGVLFKNKMGNRLLSAICAWPVLQTFTAYKVLHLQHHAKLGDKGDPDHYKNYSKYRKLIFTMHWGRLLLGYPVYITAIPILGFAKAAWKERPWILWELSMVTTMIILVWNSTISWGVIFHGWLIPMMFIHFMVNIRGMSQHTLLEHETHPVRGSRTILTNPITQFFMCNENFHLEHHLYPAVPWYNLPAVHDALLPELKKENAPFISSYWQFVLEFISASFYKRNIGTISFDQT